MHAMHCQRAVRTDLCLLADMEGCHLQSEAQVQMYNNSSSGKKEIVTPEPGIEPGSLA
jgi:hypothetical protein